LNKFKNNFIVSVGIGCDYKNIVINPTYYFGIGKKFNDLILRNELIYTQVINQFDYGIVVSYKITKGIYLTYSVNTLENRVGLAFSNN
jgi:hypothetical protein